MKRGILLLVLALVPVFLFPAVEKMRIVVFDLDAKTDEEKKSSAILSDYLRTGFINEGIFEVVSREQLDKVMKEQKIQLTGLTSEANAIKLGQLLNVKLAVVGSIGKVENTLIINIQLMNLETGQFIMADKVRAKSTDEALSQLDEKVKVLAARAMEQPRMLDEVRSALDAKNAALAREKLDAYLKKYPANDRTADLDAQIKKLASETTSTQTNTVQTIPVKTPTLYISGLNWAGYAAAGAGLIGLGLGWYFDGAAVTSYANAQTLYAQYSAATTGAASLWTSYQSSRDATATDLLLRNTLYIAGGICIAGGLVCAFIPSAPQGPVSFCIFPDRAVLACRF